ncbi:coiled-coil domain-containing protein [Pilimelia columellifera]|uniref:ARB-07466-like C-terminal domain-containing protein n=1 Tax=Pilimelia columellifera subsp. columellifera TaxID=706583 RepID=A0ABP6ATX4_9ACTN
MSTGHRSRWLAALTAATLATAMLAAAPASAADPEGGTAKLRKALDSANKGYVSAKLRIDNSKKRQTELDAQLKTLAVEHAEVAGVASKMAARAYRNGPLTEVSLLLDSSSPDAFWTRANAMERLARADAGRLGRLTESQNRMRANQAALKLEIGEQTKQLAAMAKRKKEAEEALIEAGGGAITSGFLSANSALAKPAPRRSDGSWPDESCNVNDPTTSGCITPRTLHAMKEAKRAGFGRFVSCHRGGGGGEHPKGRACDFAAATGGFENVDASGGDKSYGDRLAAFYVRNAGRLGVLYVIWYRQIWMPSTGWRSYSGGPGPSATHTNHVHLSMQ